MDGLHTLDVSWLALGCFAIVQTILLMVCDTEHFVPKWALRLFLFAVALQSGGVVLASEGLLKAAQLASASGIAWILFGLIQDIKFHRRKHQH